MVTASGFWRTGGARKCNDERAHREAKELDLVSTLALDSLPQTTLPTWNRPLSFLAREHLDSAGLSTLCLQLLRGVDLACDHSRRSML